MRTSVARTLLTLALCLGAFALGRGSPSWWPSVQAEEGGRVFELRLYTVEDGKVGRLSEVFRDNVTKMFARHGMANTAYLLPRDQPECGTFRAGATIREPAFDYGAVPLVAGHAGLRARARQPGGGRAELGLVRGG